MKRSRRFQPRAWARRICASTSGFSMPFFERNWVVQSRSRLTVHDSSPFDGRLASWLMIALPRRAQALPLARCSLPAQTLLLIESTQGADEVAPVSGDDLVN